jgi:predicted MFS family arabinose efflux permease
MTALVFGIVRAATAGWGDALTIAALAGGVVLLALLVLNEWRARQPIMPLRLFASRERAGAYAARILYLGAMLGLWFFITQYLQNVRGYSPVQAGVAFLPMTLANFAVAVAVPRLTRRLGNARLLAAGVAGVPPDDAGAASALFAHRVAVSLTAGTAMLALALIVVIALAPTRSAGALRHTEEKEWKSSPPAVRLRDRSPCSPATSTST